MFLWYDEENDNFEELETTLNKTKSYVSVTAGHFSKYMVVDKYKWYEAWAKAFNYNPNQLSDSAPVLKYNSVLAIDCSGSMRWNDPMYNIDNNSTSSPKTCGRMQAATNFVRNMHAADKASVVLFTGIASINCEITNNKALLNQAINSVYSSGGTNFNNALTTAVNAFSEDDLSAENTINRILLLTDGEDSVPDNILNVCNQKRIKVYTIGLGTTAYSHILTQIAERTGGTYYEALSADELVDIYTEIGFGDDFDKTDTDGDGLYDAVESAGIRLTNGKIITTDPTKKDTDGDGLFDGEEIDPHPVYYSKIVYLNNNTNPIFVEGYSFKFNTDPNAYNKLYNDEYGVIEYNHELYGINVPLFNNQDDDLWEEVGILYESDWNFDACKFITGVSLPDWQREAIFAGYYRVDAKVNKKKSVVYTKNDLKNNAALGNLCMILGLVQSAEDSISNVYFKLVFEKKGKFRRVTIFSGSSDIKLQYENYADNISRRSLTQNIGYPLDQAIISNGIEELYKKITNQNMPIGTLSRADIEITVDKRHKTFDYTSYLWFDGNCLMESPILFENDKIEIGTSFLTYGKFTPILTISLSGSSPASTFMQKAFREKVGLNEK